jgi:hypothetical protein
MQSTVNIVGLLEDRGASHLDHPGGNLLDHVVRTSTLLESWGAPVALVRAGMMHAAYGTDGFPTALFDLDERSLVADAIGEDAEAIVYRYGSCDRAFTLPGVGRGDDVLFRDRFTGSVEQVDVVSVERFAELTFANEIDVARHSESFRREHGRAIRSLFSAWEPLVSSAAYEDYLAVLGPAVAPTSDE